MIMFTEDYIDYLDKVVYRDRPELVSALKLQSSLLNKICFKLLNEKTDKRELNRLVEELENNSKNVHRLVKKL